MGCKGFLKRSVSVKDLKIGQPNCIGRSQFELLPESWSFINPVLQPFSYLSHGYWQCPSHLICCNSPHCTWVQHKLLSLEGVFIKPPWSDLLPNIVNNGLLEWCCLPLDTLLPNHVFEIWFGVRHEQKHSSSACIHSRTLNSPSQNPPMKVICQGFFSSHFLNRSEKDFPAQKKLFSQTYNYFLFVDIYL